MSSNIRYNEDGTHAILRNPHTEAEIAVPLTLLEQLRVLGIHSWNVDDLLRFHRMGSLGAVDGKPVAPTITTMQDLEGVDLTGKIIQFWNPNWEDSSWLECSEVATVVKNEDGEYSFVPAASYKEEFEWDEFFNRSRWGSESVTVTTINVK